MRLPFFRSKDPAPDRGPRSTPPDNAAAVAAARTRARRRLSGALVLLIAGVAGFPLLFETQPRPLPVDTPIEVRQRDASSAVAVAPSTPQSRPVLPVITEAAEPAAPASAPAEAGAADRAPAPAAAPTAAVTPPTPAVMQPAPKEIQTAAQREAPVRARDDDGARARALLEARAPMAPAASTTPTAPTAPTAATAPTAPPETGARYVVQVGAYSDASALQQARQRVERLGLKTYTQVVETGAGKRTTRVRVGPYASRDEAGAAAAKVKSAGLPAAILTL